MEQTNFLIGRGELLTYDIPAPTKGSRKSAVYSFEEARERLLPMFSESSKYIDNLPKEVCPNDFAVGQIAINPSYIAKSYFPSAFLRSAGLVSVGSRNIRIKPNKWAKKAKPIDCSTTELFVAGKRRAFRHLISLVNEIEIGSAEATEMARIERFKAFSSTEKLKISEVKKTRFFEVGMHLLPNENSTFIQDAFKEYATNLDISVYTDLSFGAGNLWFVPVESSLDNLAELSSFSFIRVIRPVPKLRGVLPVRRSGMIDVTCQLPSQPPLSSAPKVAVLDGGLPKKHPLGSWLSSYRKLDETALDVSDYLSHGLAVTSAFLFGPIVPGNSTRRPYSFVDHLRVLDKTSNNEDALELYRTLGFIEEVLLSRQYEFINLSLGPDLPIDDSDVHAWTSVIDELLSDGETFMTVAIGNNGEKDRESGNARVQVPSDCVNAISVGAADNTGIKWNRALYSAVGPGRRPGVVKPDVVCFGGSPSNYFHVIVEDNQPRLTPSMGTSFAAPYLLRKAVGIRAVLGDHLSVLAIRALLIHSAEQAGKDKLEVGWGKTPDDLSDIITSPPGIARIVYQGELKPGKYIRARIPIPARGIVGNVSLKATFCYASPVDPQDSASYTCAGLEIVFRPDLDRIKDGKENPESRSFFKTKKYATEEERRSDLGKWETVIHDEKNMQGKSLKNPVFDIHYNAREAGGSTRNADTIKYALVITVNATKHPDLYNEILRSYASLLTPIMPQIPLPVRV